MRLPLAVDVRRVACRPGTRPGQSTLEAIQSIRTASAIGLKAQPVSLAVILSRGLAGHALVLPRASADEAAPSQVLGEN